MSWNYKKDWLRKEINDNCIFRACPDTQYSLSTPKGRIPGNSFGNNIGYQYQFYLRRVLFQNFYLRIASRLLANKITNSYWAEYEDGEAIKKPFQLAAVETAGVPLAIGLQEDFKGAGFSINMFSVRKERKPSGLFHYIEGNPNELPVIVVDDLFKSGNSMARAMNTIIAELCLEIAPICVTIVSLNTKKDSPSHISNVEPLHLFTKDDFDFKYEEDKYWIPADVV